MTSNFCLTVSRAWACGLLGSALVLLASGCGPNYQARGTVTGKVTRGKTPLTTGTVMFINKDGMSASASIDPDGNYVMPDAPLGECQVTVRVPTLPMDPTVRARLQGRGPQMPAGPKMPDGEGEDAGPGLPSAPRVPKTVVPIDEKYSKPETSGLKFTVEKGEQTYNIEL